MRTPQYKPEFARKVFDILSEGGSISKAASEIGVSKKLLLTWARDSAKPEMVDAIENGLTAAQAYHEDLLQKISKGLYLKGSATAQMFYMKNAFKEDYTESVAEKINVTNNINKMTDQEIDEKIKYLLSKSPEKKKENN